jgi:hypothetical protein
MFCDSGISTHLIGWNEISNSLPRELSAYSSQKMARAFNSGMYGVDSDLSIGWTEIFLGSELSCAEEAIDGFLDRFLHRLNEERRFFDRLDILGYLLVAPLKISCDIMEQLRERRRSSKSSSVVSIKEASNIVSNPSSIVNSILTGTSQDTSQDNDGNSIDLSISSVQEYIYDPLPILKGKSHPERSTSVGCTTLSVESRADRLLIDTDFSSSTPPAHKTSSGDSRSLPRLPLIPIQTSKSLNRPSRKSLQQFPTSSSLRRDIIPSFADRDNENDSLKFKRILDDYSSNLQRPTINIPYVGAMDDDDQFTDIAQCSSLPDRYPRGGISISEFVARMTSAKVCDLEFTRVFLMLYPRWMTVCSYL